MAKGIHKQRSLGEEVMRLDGTLLLSVRRNLDVLRKLAGETEDSGLKERLGKFLSRHALARKNPIPEKKVEAHPVTERERRMATLSRHVSSLPDIDLQSVLILVKSMSRSQKTKDPKAAPILQ